MNLGVLTQYTRYLVYRVCFFVQIYLTIVILDQPQLSKIMKVTITDLKNNTDQLLKLAAGGKTIIITENGHEIAQLIPYSEALSDVIEENSADELFGMWRDRDDISDVNAYIRQIRKNPFH